MSERKSQLGAPKKDVYSLIYQYQKKYIDAWRLKNKDKIDKQNKTIVTCEVCNKNITYQSINSHNKTKKHLKNITNTEQLPLDINQ